MYKPLIYLDNCCYGRPFDNQFQLEIYNETEAVKYLQDGIQEERFDLVWSFILDIENSASSHQRKKESVEFWKTFAVVNITESPKIILLAKKLERLGIKQKDALHVACAVEAAADFFITTDLRLLKKPVSEIRILNPIDFVNLAKEVYQ